ncbi:class I SAM-dependent methyltransferase [Sedimenticola sp.]|uniref:class I SAM-dependent methyltransferase n=1 Tax=Sedimenticola sp. TaxID=1940285 RepID=UPI003D152B7E
MKQQQASATAFTVQQGVLYTAQNPRYFGLVSEETKDACVKILASSREGRKRLKQLGSWWFVQLAPLIECLVMPGITLHYVLRKRYIEELTVQVIQEGVSQVINLGAGLDTLACRLAKRYPNVNFIEADHPATQQIKTRSLETSQNKFENLHLIPVDFTTQKLEEALKQCSGFSADKVTLFILEGVLMYLDEAQIRQLFNSLKQAIHTRIEVIFTAAEPASKSRNSHGLLLKLYLRFKGEPLHWTCEKEDINGFLQSMGYALNRLADYRDFRRRYLRSIETGAMHEGEYIAVARHNQGNGLIL